MKIYDLLFFLIAIFLLFNNIPDKLQINFIAETLQSKLVFYPIFVGIIYTLYCQYKYKNVLVNFDKFVKFTIVYLGGICLSTIIGVIYYPYYDLIINAPVVQTEKLQIIIGVLNNFGINTDEKVLTILWIAIRSLKNIVFEFIYTFASSYMIYCWYYDNWRKAFNIVIKAILISLIIVFAYCGVELFYLAGNDYATDILITITPYLHTIKGSYNWWPPLLLDGQLRSIFAEPSYYGIYFAFAMPFLWYRFFIVNNTLNKILSYFGILFFSFCLFLTQARTSVALFCGELIVLFIFVILFDNKILFQQFLKLIMCILIAFIMSTGFINNLLANNRYNIDGLESYVESNLLSLSSSEQRSNGARYSIMLTDLKIGLYNPILGVGHGLRSSYIPDYLPEIAQNNREIKMWKQFQQQKGILKSGYPRLGEYTARFGETGIINSFLFLLPAVILLKKLYIKLTDKIISFENKLLYLFFTISLIGIMASGLGDSINITYCYWVLLGLGYAMCFGKENDVKADGTTRYKQEH